MSHAADFSESFSVSCPRCECRFQPAVRLTSYFAKCPDCSEPVRVPAAGEMEDDREGGLQSDGDTYRIALPADWHEPPGEVRFDSYPSESRRPPDVREQPRVKREPDESSPPDSGETSRQELADETPPPNASRVTCPACGASFERPPSDQPQVVLCPECLEDVHVPAGGMQSPPSPAAPAKTKSSRRESAEPVPDAVPWDSFLEESAEPPADRPKKKRRKKPRTDVGTPPAENPTRREKSSKNVFDTMAEVRQVGEDPPPEWTFFSGVTDFLIRPEVALRWAFASLGWCVWSWLCALCLHFYLSGLFLALPFFVLPLIWITIMTLSYTAANSMSILLETSAGIDTVEGWPEPVMKEQAVDLVYLCYLLIVAEVFSFFLGQVVGVLIGPGWLVSLVFLVLLYPVVLLSSLEANSAFVPLTMPILKSFKSLTWAWGAFHGLAGGLMLVWVVPLLWSIRQSGGTQFLAMIFIAPLIAGWCFLYARLLGHLAWLISLEFPEEEDEEDSDTKPKAKRSKTKKKKPKLSESSGELQAAR